MIGKKLLHYEIVAKLGAGGMGEVYRARDTKLQRDVAIKVLASKTAGSADRRKRFLREATAVAALKHPNIVTIHSVEDEQGTLFIVMELLEGKSLDHLIPPQGLNLTQLLDLSIPVLDAVAYAHEKGITHRDLKPGNIMLDEAGRPKVLDFGLAKLLEAPVAPEAATVAADGSVTREGTVIGTASYMSPEQAEGKPTDPRSDVFSLGIILYEMATGRKPFQGETTISTISSILKDTPAPVTDLNRSLPNHLGRVVQRCLAKDPSKRYQVALDLKNELEGLREESSGAGEISAGSTVAATSAVPGPNRARLLVGGAVVVALVAVLAVWRPWSGGKDGATGGEAATSVTAGDTPGANARTGRKMAVVLPFENLGPPEDAYFAAGVTEEITNRLAAVSGLGVISRTTATQYDRAGKTLRQIGEDLGVDYVLEGSVRWARGSDGGGQVRISPRLVSVKDDLQIWSETYDKTIDDIFEVQTSIATSVIDELGVTLLGAERELVEERPTQSREAYDAYLQALDLQNTDHWSNDARIVELLERATRLDPKFLAAWFQLTSHHAFAYHTGFDRTEVRLAKAKAALQGAEAVDPDHPRTHLARGFYYYYGFREYDRALEEFLAAAEAVPNDVEARLAIGYIHRRQGKLEESVRDLRAALDLDPQNTSAITNLASTYGALRQFDDADRLLDRLIEVSPPDDYDPYVLKAGLIARWKGDLSAAREILTRAPGRGIFYDIAWMELHMWERDFPAAMEAAVRIPETPPIFGAFRLTQIALIETHIDGTERARQSLESALAACQKILDGAPGNAQVHRLTAALYAYLGQDDAALKEVKLAVDLKAKDAYEGPQVLEDLAGVYAVAGRLDEAFDLLERLLNMQYAEPMTIHILQTRPVWDGLRGDPRYQELLEKYGEKIP